jgi:hypothetical protein
MTFSFLLLISTSLALAAGLRVGALVHAPSAGCRAFTTRASGVKLFDENLREKAKSFEVKTITRSAKKTDPKPGRTGTVVVTDGSNSFFKSRALVQQLHDFGSYASIVASSTSSVDAKKMLLSRTARYSGLIDVLSFEEAAVPSFEGADAWLCVNADGETLAPQIDAAEAAGVKRAFVLTSTPLDSKYEDQLSNCGLDYTLIRTGSLVDGPAGEGLKLGPLDLPVCEDVAMEDVFRFVTEAMTLPEASKKIFSLCPSDGTTAALKQMRLAGYERRDEVKAMLTNALPDSNDEAAAAVAMSPEEAAANDEIVLRSQAEVEAEREAELKELLAKAKARGEATQARLKHEEEERLAHRKEQEKYYKTPGEGDDSDDKPVPLAEGDDKDTKA